MLTGPPFRRRLHDFPSATIEGPVKWVCCFYFCFLPQEMQDKCQTAIMKIKTELSRQNVHIPDNLSQ